jgi:hypothetical protein
MAIMFSDPIIQLGLFISAYIIVTGVCTYFGYSPAEYGLYMAFTAFMLSISMMLPDPIKIGNNLNTAVNIVTSSLTNSPTTSSVNPVVNQEIELANMSTSKSV